MSEKRFNYMGHTLNWRTVDMIEVAESNLGHPVKIFQGSYNKGGVKQSAGTHDGGGAVDVWPTGNTVDSVVLQMRVVGFAAWHRTPAQGDWGHHIHAEAIGDPELSAGAQTQVREYYAGQNGLASHKRDDGPRIKIVTFEEYVAAHPRKMQVSVNVLNAKLATNSKKPNLGVKRVQRCLNARFGLNLAEDGVAGPQTKAAVKNFQKSTGQKPVLKGRVISKKSLEKLLKGHYGVRSV